MHISNRFRSIQILSVIIIFLFTFQGAIFAQSKIDKIDELIQAYHDLGQFNGTALVAENGKVIYQKGFGMANIEWNIPNKPDTKFRLGSVTKQFTAMLILQLVAEGQIDLEGRLADYLPYYRKDVGEKVTVHHLLTHTSGIPSYTGLPNFFQDISRDPYGVDEFVQKYCSGDLEFEPGSKFAYNNSGYFLLGAIIEKVTGETYEEMSQERIFKPLGMKNSGYDHHDTIIPNRATGYARTFDGYTNSPYLDMSLPYAAGSLYSTVEDLYIWDQALYSEKILSQEMKDLYFKSHVKAMGGSYAYGWVFQKRKLPESKKELNIIAHGGGINGFNTLIDRMVDERHLVVLFNNSPGASLGNMSTAITRILYDEAYNLPKQSIAEAIYPTLVEKGVEAAVEKYRGLKKAKSKEYIFQARELNRLGYYLLHNKKRIEDAIAIFKFNIEMYPKYFNAYDSLAEAYMVKGDKDLAIKNYAKSLELNPKNITAIEKLNELVKKK
jgi:CubicO group peptidase (beta-lactamase class C family)